MSPFKSVQKIVSPLAVALAIGLAAPLTGTLASAQDATTKAGITPPLPAAPYRVDAKIEKTANKLIAAGLKDRLGYDVIESLTTEIGPRLAGSDNEARARAWGVAKLKKLGFKNVRIEPFEVPYWERKVERAKIVSPFPQPLIITTLGNSIATPDGGTTGQIVRFETLEALEDAPLTGFEGKIIFVDEMMARSQDGSGYGKAVRKRSGAAKEAGKRDAAAALIRSVGTDHHRLPHTGGMGYADDVKQVPIAALSPPDADQLARALKRGNVIVKLDIDVVTMASRPSGNVIGEIPGKTDEIIVIGGHLDSWDLGTGAVDDGAGIGITVGAAHLIKKLRQKPRRTIRVVMFGAEETGLFGGIEYARAHAHELDKHILGAESDFGAGKIWRMQTRFGESQLDKGDAIARVLSPLKIGRGNNQASGGPDMGPIRRLGVPVISLTQDGTDYFDLHHTADDTFDKINPDDIAQNVAAYAAMVWMASEMNVDFRDPISPGLSE